MFDYEKLIGLLVKSNHALIASYCVDHDNERDVSIVMHLHGKSCIVEFRHTIGQHNYWSILTAIRQEKDELPRIVMPGFGAGTPIVEKDRADMHVIYTGFFESTTQSARNPGEIAEAYLTAFKSIPSGNGRFDALNVQRFMPDRFPKKVVEREFIQGFDMHYLRAFVKFVAGIDYRRLYPKKENK